MRKKIQCNNINIPSIKHLNSATLQVKFMNYYIKGNSTLEQNKGIRVLKLAEIPTLFSDW